MKNWFLKVICFAFIAIFIVSGCEQTNIQQTLTLDVEPNIVTEVSGFAAQSFDASGGLTAWRKTKRLQMNCVVSFIQPDESYYLTEQRYDIYPWSNTIRISTYEPQAMLVWQLTKGDFQVLEGGGQFEGMTNTVSSRGLAESILNILTAPARFLDSSVEFGKEPSPVKMHGQWYYLINRKNKITLTSTGRMSEAIYYQNKDSLAIDMIWFPRMNGNELLMIRGYDYEEVEKAGIIIPARIEIYRTDALGISQQLLIKIDCSKIQYN